MNNIEYTEFVKSKVKPGQDILNSLTPDKCHLLHMAMGISGEVAELVMADGVKHEKEELGDLIFFIVGAGQAIEGWEWPQLDYRINDLEGTIEEALVEAAGNFLDLVKKYAIYNKNIINIGLIVELADLIGVVQLFIEESGYDMEEILTHNMDKLNTRYKSGYSDAEAQARADKKEGE